MPHLDLKRVWGSCPIVFWLDTWLWRINVYKDVFGLVDEFIIPAQNLTVLFAKPGPFAHPLGWPGLTNPRDISDSFLICMKF
jgi:hypothetical protein